MSFFNDFLKHVNVSDNDFCINIILNKSVFISGSFNVLDFNDTTVIMSVNNKIYKIIGNNLNIKSLAKNEMIVQGNVLGFVEG